MVLVHGWESARDRTIPHAQVLHAAGFHVLTFDVRGNGANGPEVLPMSVGEYAADARAAVAELRRHPEVTTIGVLGHSMGGAGALVAAAEDHDVAAVIAASTPADPYRLTRQTFRLARLPIPAPIAWPLAWLTTRVFLRPRGHTVRSVSATSAVRAIDRPVLLIHGSEDGVVPIGDLARLAAARRAARPSAVTETLLVEGGRHSWLYEFPEYRAAVARFLTATSAARSRPTRPPGSPGRAGGAPARPRAADDARRGARRLPVFVAGAEAPGVGRVDDERRDDAGCNGAGVQRRASTVCRRPRSQTPPRQRPEAAGLLVERRQPLRVRQALGLEGRGGQGGLVGMDGAAEVRRQEPATAARYSKELVQPRVPAALDEEGLGDRVGARRPAGGGEAREIAGYGTTPSSDPWISGTGRSMARTALVALTERTVWPRGRRKTRVVERASGPGDRGRDGGAGQGGTSGGSAGTGRRASTPRSRPPRRGPPRPPPARPRRPSNGRARRSW